MQHETRQLLVGLDAMEWDLVRQWAGEGKLPVFQSLLQQGFSSELTTTSAQLPDTVWPSLYSGSNPAKAGKYFYLQYDAPRGDLKMLKDDEVKCTPFWDHLGRAGRKAVVIDAPKFPLSKEGVCVQVSNWGAHATRTARASNPPSLIGEIDRRFGRHPVTDCDKVDESVASLRDLGKRVREGVRAHGELFRWAMEHQEWDVFFGSFAAPHCIGHHFWRFMDPSHSRHVPGDPDRLGNTIFEVYAAIDHEIGTMIEAAGRDVRTMVFAGHGMGAIYHASWNLMEILDLLGFGRANASTKAAETREASRSPWRMLKMLAPGWLQYAIKDALPKRLQDELLFRWYSGSRDWAGRRAIAIPNNDSVGAIRIQLQGRDRLGVVPPSRYAAFCREVADALNELRDPVSGRPVVRQVTITAEEFDGPYLEELPDLTVLWDQRFPWEAVQSPRFGTLRIRRQDARSGSHTPHGFVIAAGPGIRAGEDPRPCSIYDIAPTVLEWAGVPAPDSMDGRPLPVSEPLPLPAGRRE